MTYSDESFHGEPKVEQLPLLQRMLRFFHSKMEERPAVAQYRQGISRFSELLTRNFPEGSLSHWSLCAGSGVSSVVTGQVASFLSRRFDVEVRIVEAVAAEKDICSWPCYEKEP